MPRQTGSGMGSGGQCLCPKCGKKIAHRRGVPCLEERCPECGSRMVREGSYHHQNIEGKKKSDD